MATTNYSWNLPTVGGSEDTWGTQLNANWTALDTLLGGTNATEFAILDGATVTTAELNQLDGNTFTALTTSGSVTMTGGASDWTFSVSGNNLVINYGGVAKAKLDTSGNLTVTGDVTAFGTI